MGKFPEQHVDELERQYRRERVFRWFLRIFPWAFVVVGAVVVFFGLKTVWKSVRSAGWVSAPGVVRTSKYVSVDETVDRSHSNEPGNRMRAVDRLSMVYEFTVRARKYRGYRVSFALNDKGDGQSGGVTSRYPEGKVVQVYYDPGDPEESVLEPGFRWGTLFMPGLGLVFFLGGMGMARLIGSAGG